jgi:hypothetical protein
VENPAHSASFHAWGKIAPSNPETKNLGHRPQMLWAMGYGLWAMGYGLWAMGYGLWAMGYGLWAMGYGLWAMGYGLCNKQ